MLKKKLMKCNKITSVGYVVKETKLSYKKRMQQISAKIV